MRKDHTFIVVLRSSRLFRAPLKRSDCGQCSCCLLCSSTWRLYTLCRCIFTSQNSSCQLHILYFVFSCHHLLNLKLLHRVESNSPATTYAYLTLINGISIPTYRTGEGGSYRWQMGKSIVCVCLNANPKAILSSPMCFLLASADTMRWIKPLQQGNVKMSVWTLPDILILHLKRFCHVGKRWNKLITRVHFWQAGQGTSHSELLAWHPHTNPRRPAVHPLFHLFGQVEMANYHHNVLKTSFALLQV